MDNIADIDNNIDNHYNKKLKTNYFFSHDNSLLQSLTSNSYLLIITQHNVVSFHNYMKQLQIIHEVYLNNINILGLTKTNLLSQSIKYQKSYLSKEYIYFFNSSSSYKGSGVGLYVKQHITDYVFYHYDNHGQYIYINL